MTFKIKVTLKIELEYKPRHPNRELRDMLGNRDGWVCPHCGRPMLRPDQMTPKQRRKMCNDKLYPTIDHIVPQNEGGDHTPDNLQLLCRSCNSSKQDRYYQALGDK